jgi:hypothetical protein
MDEVSCARNAVNGGLSKAGFDANFIRYHGIDAEIEPKRDLDGWSENSSSNPDELIQSLQDDTSNNYTQETNGKNPGTANNIGINSDSRNFVIRDSTFQYKNSVKYGNNWQIQQQYDHQAMMRDMFLQNHPGEGNPNPNKVSKNNQFVNDFNNFNYHSDKYRNFPNNDPALNSKPTPINTKNYLNSKKIIHPP